MPSQLVTQPLVIDQQNGQFTARTLDGKTAGELEAQKIMQTRFGKSVKELFGIAVLHKSGATALLADTTN